MESKDRTVTVRTKVEFDVDDRTRAALVVLGWTPPADDHETCEAYGAQRGLGAGMSETVWALPPFGRYDIKKMTAWAAAQGFDARTISADGFHITRESDGTYLAHGVEFLHSEDGHYVLDEATGTFAKREWTHPVSGTPTVDEVSA